MTTRETTNDDLLTTAQLKTESVVEALVELRSRYARLSEERGDGYDPERLDGALRAADILLGEIGDLDP